MTTIHGIIQKGIVNAQVQFDKLGYVSTNVSIGLFTAGLFIAFFGQIGDLVASVIKRQYGIKDYGKIMPGHGGVMDRFDSILFVAPILYFYMQLVL